MVDRRSDQPAKVAAAQKCLAIAQSTYDKAPMDKATQKMAAKPDSALTSDLARREGTNGTGCCFS